MEKRFWMDTCAVITEERSGKAQRVLAVSRDVAEGIKLFERMYAETKEEIAKGEAHALNETIDVLNRDHYGQPTCMEFSYLDDHNFLVVYALTVDYVQVWG
jgi:hypothetical protein